MRKEEIITKLFPHFSAMYKSRQEHIKNQVDEIVNELLIDFARERQGCGALDSKYMSPEEHVDDFLKSIEELKK